VDFTALSTKLAASGADCVFLASTAEQSANLILQARQAGLAPNVRFLITSSAASQQFINAGGRAVEGAYLVADFVPGGMNEQGRAFVEAYQRRFGRPPDNWAAVGYTKMMVVAQAMRAAQPDPSREGVRAALSQVRNLPVVLGEGTFSLDENRVPSYGGAILVVRNGQFTAP
jgi:branched-chain amino acid transport system substrate-binding protein